MTHFFCDIVQIGTHNSSTSSKNHYVFYKQHNTSIKEQLDLGCRFFTIDVYNGKKGLVLRHGSEKQDWWARFPYSLWKDKVSCRDFLKQIKRFMDENPNELITISWQNGAGREVVDDEMEYVFGSLIMKKSDIVHAGILKKNLPTIEWMVENNKRLFNFDRRHPSEYRWNTNNLWKNKPGSLKMEDMLKSQKNVDTDTCLYQANVHLSPSFRLFHRRKKINTNVLDEFLTKFAQKYGRLPNFINLDHEDIGEPFKIVQSHL